MVTATHPDYAETSWLEDERRCHAEEVERLRREITELNIEQGRYRELLAKADHAAMDNEAAIRNWRLLEQHIAGPLADYLADLITIKPEQYQADGSGRQAVCLEQEQITVDMRDEDLIPVEVIASKTLPDGSVAKVRCRLDAASLRYDLEYVD